MKKIKFLFVSMLAVLAVSCASGETEQKKDEKSQGKENTSNTSNTTEAVEVDTQEQDNSNEVFNHGEIVYIVEKDYAGASPNISPETIKDFGRPTVIEFGATWCGPCKQAKPIFEDIALKYQGKAQFLYVDIDEHPQIAKEFEVEQVPFVVVAKADGSYEKVENLEAIKADLESKVAAVVE